MPLLVASRLPAGDNAPPPGDQDQDQDQQLGRKHVQHGKQGVGHVGLYLCKLLHDAGAVLFISDVNNDNIRMTLDAVPATVIPPSELIFADVDVLAPCALGNILTSSTIPKIKAKIIAECANGPVTPTGDAILNEKDVGDDEDALLVEDRAHRAVELRSQSVARFHADVLESMDAVGMPVAINPMPSEIADAVRFDRQDARRVRLARPTSEAFEISLGWLWSYADATRLDALPRVAVAGDRRLRGGVKRS